MGTDQESSTTQKLVDLLLTTKKLFLKGGDLLMKCGLKPNMIVKAFESKLVKPIAE